MDDQYLIFASLWNCCWKLSCLLPLCMYPTHLTEIPCLSPLVPIRNITNLNVSLGSSWWNKQPFNWIQVGPWTHIKTKQKKTQEAAVWPPLPVKTVSCSRVNLFISPPSWVCWCRGERQVRADQHSYMLLPNKVTFKCFPVNHNVAVQRGPRVHGYNFNLL